MQIEEGFFKSEEDEYSSLKNNIESTMAPYCELATFIEGRMKKIYMSNKFTDSATLTPGDSEAEANARIEQTYKEVYSCTDDSANSRPSCSKYKGLSLKALKKFFIGRNAETHTQCSLYFNLPDYSEGTIDSIADELSKIPNKLASTISKELEWYVSVMDDLQKGQDAGANPPAKAPSGEEIAGEIAKKKKEEEGFADKCSPEVARLKREKRKSSGYCILPDLPSEISRVRKIIKSKALKDVISKSNSLLARAKKIQSDLQKLEAGTLYDWQQLDKGPKQSYASFKGGDRSASFVSALKANSDWNVPK